MPLDSNGNASLVPSYFVQDGDDVLPVQHNPPLEDIASMISMTLIRDGRAPMSGNLNMSGNKVTNLAEPTNPNDAARLVDLPTGAITSEIIHEESGTTLLTSATRDILDIAEDFRAFELEAEISSISSNPGTVYLLLNIGSNGSWATPGVSRDDICLTKWSSGTTSRRFLTRVTNLDEAALAVFMRTEFSEGVFATDQTGYAFTPTSFASRPINALRLYGFSSGSAVTINISKFRVRGIRA